MRRVINLSLNDSSRNDFYDKQLQSPNIIRRCWHNGRRILIHRLVAKYYNGGVIADLGCGNCTWNYRSDYIVTGIDKNREALRYAINQKRIAHSVCADVVDTGLQDGVVQLLVSSEVMEHIPDTDGYLKEVYRLLSNNGIFIVTLPYDTCCSLWKPLFALQCFLKGNMQRDPYYINKCGHIHHYGKKKLKNRLRLIGFKVKEIGVYYGMTLYCVAYKEVET